jgi:RNA polymerase sigma factor (sigma-70 family)
VSGKDFGAAAHTHEVALTAISPESVESSPALDFDSIYRAWFHRVERWLVALGAPDSEIEDWTQKVFEVVLRKLDHFDGDNLAGWLYRIAARTASDQRRRAWFQRLFRGARNVDFDLFEAGDSPAVLLERKEDRRTLLRLLGQMNPKRRTVLVLAEIDGLSGVEIADLTGTKLATVWTQLFRARQEFVALVAKEAP